MSLSFDTCQYGHFSLCYTDSKSIINDGADFYCNDMIHLIFSNLVSIIPFISSSFDSPMNHTSHIISTSFYLLSLLLYQFRFVLVGDDYQLPPIVISSEAQSRGMDISLLRRLIEAHPEAATCLTAQYRMNEQIMSICNTLIYENRMTCATSSVANARLNLPQLKNLTPSHPVTNCLENCQNQKDRSEIFKKNKDGKFTDSIVNYTDTSLQLSIPYGVCDLKNRKLKSWIYHCIDPLNSVVFLNTDTLYDNQSTSAGTLLRVGPGTTDKLNSHFNPRETATSNNGYLTRGERTDSITNFQYDSKESNIHEAEVNVVCQLVVGLLLAGFDVRKNKGLGVISPYRSQVRALRDSLSTLLKDSSRSGLLGSACTPSTNTNREEGISQNKSKSKSLRQIDDQRLKQADEGGGGDENQNHEFDETTPECDVSTVDSFQGRDMDMIIFSTVKNKNTQGGSVSVSTLQ